jgi:hypothetical protein
MVVGSELDIKDRCYIVVKICQIYIPSFGASQALILYCILPVVNVVLVSHGFMSDC